MTETEKIPVLLVDDLPENLTALAEILGNMGLEIFTASSGNEALSLSLKYDFAIVLMDVRMPDMDGFETVELMRANPKTGRLPIIFVTAAMNDVEQLFKGYETGAFDYLLKPIEPAIVRNKVRVFCDLYQQRIELEMHELELETFVVERTCELERTLNSLRDSESRYRDLLASVTGYVYTVVLNCGTVVSTTHGPGCLAVTGFSAEEYATAPDLWYRMIHQDDRQAVLDAAQQALTAKSATTLEHRINHKDGSIRWVQTTLVPHVGTEGEIQSYDGVITDITARKRVEEALRRDSEEIHDLYNLAPCGYHSLDRDGVYIRINDTELQWLGYTRDEILGKMRFSDLVTEISLQTFRDSFTRFKEQGWIRDLEFELVRKDGTILPVLVSATAIYDVDGTYLMSRATMYDITERKKAEEKEHLLSAIVQSSDDAVISKDLNGVILSWNRGAERIYGYGAEEAIGKSVDMLTPPDRPDELAEILSRLKRGEPIEHYTTERIRKDGQRIAISLTVSPLFDGGGDIMGASAIARDITEQKRVEQALRENETFLDTIIESEPECVKLLGPDGTLIRMNRAGLTMIQADSLEQVKDQCVYPLVAPEYRDAFIKLVEKVFLGGAGKLEFEMVGIKGRMLWLDTYVVPLRNERNDIIALLGITRDVTERKRAEEEIHELTARLEKRVDERTLELQESQQALMNIVEDLNLKTGELEEANAKLKEIDRLKSMFIASMSHELRTPLNSIIGFSSVILNEWSGQVNAEQKENLAIILRSGKHLLNLINDVIDVSKIEAGKIESMAEEFDLYDLISEAVSLLRKDLTEKGLDLQVVAPHQQMFVDRRRLLQCVLNLLSNAMKFTERGGVTMEARIWPEPCNAQNASFADISVTDTGIGITREDLPRMFQPFVRLVSPLQATVPGTGLGLYLTRKLAAEVLQGEILVTSEYGKGSRFTIRIPVRAHEKGRP